MLMRQLGFNAFLGPVWCECSKLYCSRREHRPAVVGWWVRRDWGERRSWGNGGGLYCWCWGHGIFHCEQLLPLCRPEVKVGLLCLDEPPVPLAWSDAHLHMAHTAEVPSVCPCGQSRFSRKPSILDTWMFYTYFHLLSNQNYSNFTKNNSTAASWILFHQLVDDR